MEGSGRSSRSSATARARVSAAHRAAASSRNIRVEVADAAEPRAERRHVRPRARRPPVHRARNAAGARRSSLAGDARAGGARWRSCRRAVLAAGAEAVRPGGVLVYSTCTISSAENERRIADFLDSHPDFSADDLGAELPGLRLCHAAHARRLGALPDDTSRIATAPPASSSRGSGGADGGGRDTRRPVRPAIDLGPECPNCGEPWLRPSNLPGRYRCVFCLHRFELTSVCPNCGEHSTIVRMSSTAIMKCNNCGDSMLQAI